MSTATNKPQPQQIQQAAAADYRFGWRAHSLGAPYTGMHSEAEKDGWIAAWDAAMQSPTLAAIRKVVGL